MKTIAEYTLLSESDAAALEKQANEMIKAGWQPFGSPCLFQANLENILYHQAMVKYEE
jgi:hypothetical protein